jgi:hypothetical protein
MRGSLTKEKGRKGEREKLRKEKQEGKRREQKSECVRFRLLHVKEHVMSMLRDTS